LAPISPDYVAYPHQYLQANSTLQGEGKEIRNLAPGSIIRYPGRFSEAGLSVPQNLYQVDAVYPNQNVALGHPVVPIVSNSSSLDREQGVLNAKGSILEVLG
jgi:hypothetical protein